MQQLDLFQDRTVRLVRARRALHDFDLATAEREFAEQLALYPGDRAAREALELVRGLLGRLVVHDASGGDGLAALQGLEPALPAELRNAWHRAMAREIERSVAALGTVPAELAGLHWLLAGEPDRAERALRGALEREPTNARARGYLADALFARGELPRSRTEYLRAFLQAPAAVDLERLADPEIVALPQLAVDEYEAEDDPASWIAAVGTVEGTFPAPKAILPGLREDEEAASGTEQQSGLRFYRHLVEERRAQTLDERVVARRAMKRLCPALLAAYLERMR